MEAIKESFDYRCKRKRKRKRNRNATGKRKISKTKIVQVNEGSGSFYYQPKLKRTNHFSRLSRFLPLRSTFQESQLKIGLKKKTNLSGRKKEEEEKDQKKKPKKRRRRKKNKDTRPRRKQKNQKIYLAKLRSTILPNTEKTSQQSKYKIASRMEETRILTFVEKTKGDSKLREFWGCKENCIRDEQKLMRQTKKKYGFNTFKYPVDYLIERSLEGRSCLELETNLRLSLGLNQSQGNVGLNLSKKELKVLDAPGLVDDFYLNVLDWSQPSDLVAAALNRSLYIWDVTNEVSMELFEAKSQICSVCWNPVSPTVLVGLNSSQIQLWDNEKKVCIRKWNSHNQRVSVLSWGNGNFFTSGSRDSMIINHDLRAQNESQQVLKMHKQEITGLEWSNDSLKLASGGNDNMLHVWSRENFSRPVASFKHKAAVKAIAWCGWQSNLLVSGGGSNDQTISVLDLNKIKRIRKVKTGAQVSSIVFGNDRVIASGHGMNSNQIKLWKFPQLELVGELNGHKKRVLNLAISKDKSNLVSCAGDESIRFWKIGLKKELKEKNKIKKRNLDSVLSWKKIWNGEKSNLVKNWEKTFR
ncbi:cell division cycle 20 cdc20 fizzy -related [Anaeramoeba flamelloides]|uniref:Cell division cycle 20 cdc20 fizzy -related n=1 Tax=Anaeramoeba flamelloides TaxID=1746091 RepID=A0AAV8ABG0_9EUKA|nr:cell division cycle 20 cdc20 fizzy -related [Anaeramoeba flamelloides]